MKMPLKRCSKSPQTHPLLFVVQQRLDMAHKLEPGPILELQVSPAVALHHGHSPLLLDHGLDVLADDEAPHLGLQQRQEAVDDLVPQLLQRAQDARLEEDLAQADPVQLRVHPDLVEDLATSALGLLGGLDSRGGENAVAVQELAEQESGWVALAADTDACGFVT